MQCRDGLDRVDSATDGLRRLRERPKWLTSLPAAMKFFDCPGDIFDGDVRIDAVLIEQVDGRDFAAFAQRKRPRRLA